MDRKEEHAMALQSAQARAAKVERICLICRKRWPAECGRKNCDCEGQGHLYAIGGYIHPSCRRHKHGI